MEYTASQHHWVTWNSATSKCAVALYWAMTKRTFHMVFLYIMSFPYETAPNNGADMMFHKQVMEPGLGLCVFVCMPQNNEGRAPPPTSCQWVVVNTGWPLDMADKVQVLLGVGSQYIFVFERYLYMWQIVLMASYHSILLEWFSFPSSDLIDEILC